MAEASALTKVVFHWGRWIISKEINLTTSDNDQVRLELEPFDS